MHTFLYLYIVFVFAKEGNNQVPYEYNKPKIIKNDNDKTNHG